MPCRVELGKEKGLESWVGMGGGETHPAGQEGRLEIFKGIFSVEC